MYFDEGTVNVVDSWLKNASATAGKSLANLTTTAPKSTTSTRAGADARKGLGYEAPKRDPIRNTDVAADNMMNKAKMKDNKRKREQQDMDASELHGLVEDEIVRAGDRKPKGGFKKDLKTTDAAPTTAKPTSAISKQGGGNNSTKSSNDPISKVNDKDSTAWSGHSNKNATNDDPEKRMRKRKKTRSKQKNIRKDNRADSFKPESLRVGSKDYAGRPLTEETKKKLGL